MTQLDLTFDERAAAGRFDAFHAEHPEVFEKFRELATNLLERGTTRYSARGLFHVLRYHCELEGHPGGFKIDNRFSPHYARLLVREDPRFVGFFEMRKARGDAAA